MAAGPGASRIEQSQIRDNNAPGDGVGGAIENDGGTLEVVATTFTGNSGRNGGAIYNNSLDSGIAPTLWITDSAFYNNSARASGGVLTNGDGVATVDGSTFAGNNADARGGAIRLGNGSVTLRNSTISGNRADEGGAIYTNGTLRFTHVTVSDNENTAGTASLEIAGGTTRMFGSIIANSVNAADCAVSGGSFVDEGFNLVEDGSCISADSSLSGDPRLDPLADNGGPATPQSRPPKPMRCRATARRETWCRRPTAHCPSISEMRRGPRARAVTAAHTNGRAWHWR